MSSIVTVEGGVVSIAVLSATLELSFCLLYYPNIIFQFRYRGPFNSVSLALVLDRFFLRGFDEGSLIFIPCCAGFGPTFLLGSFERVLGDEKSNFLLTSLF